MDYRVQDQHHQTKRSLRISVFRSSELIELNFRTTSEQILFRRDGWHKLIIYLVFTPLQRYTKDNQSYPDLDLSVERIWIPATLRVLTGHMTYTVCRQLVYDRKLEKSLPRQFVGVLETI